ncbi:MAG: FtsX-like permease family protein [Ruminococcus sp.]|nr:FtsX-like permease family protein [Ruminococcus sp.]
MKNAYWKDIWRSISKGKKRFLSIAMIATLGVTMMCGLKASCDDLRYSADQFFDEQNLFDIRILSTLGLTDEDVKALESLDEISLAEGGYSETVYTMVDEVEKSIEIRTLSEKEMNLPYLLEGEMPKKANEIVITKNYKNQTGKDIGDVITLTEETENLKSQTYTITGIIIDALDINSTEGSMGFRSTALTDYVGYVIPEAADSDIFTVLYLRVNETEELNCYTDAYTDKIDQLVDQIESEIKKSREQARYDAVYGDAMDEWLDGEQEMNEEFAKADAEIADAKQEIADGWQELADGKQEIADAKQELADGKQEIVNGWQELADGKQKIEDSKKEISDGKQQIADAKKELSDGKQKLAVARADLEAGKKELQSGEAELNSQEQTANAEFAKARQEISDGYTQIASGQAQLDAAYEQIQSGQEQLDAGKAELTAQETAAKEQIAAGWQEINTQEEMLNASYAELEAGKAELETQKAALLEQKAGIEDLLKNPELPAEEKAMYEQTLQQLEAGLLVIAESEAELAAGYEQLETGKQQLEAGKAELTAQETAANEQFAAAWVMLDEKQAELDAGLIQYQEGVKELEAAKNQLLAGEQELNVQETYAKEQIAAGRQKIQAGWQEIVVGEQELAKGEQEITDGEQELAKQEQKLLDGEKELIKAEQEIIDGEEELVKAEQEIADGEKELADAEQELLDGEQELLDGEKELADSIAEYEEEKAKAEKELADALEEINDIDMTKWYVQDRTSLSGYSNVIGDADSIEAIGDIFPILFLVVAILVSLTTVTRMVEEERGLIGTYKALGFSNAEIRRKYLIYAASACLLGGILGDIGGYLILPTIIFIVFGVMYTISEYFYQFDILFGGGGILLFEVGILGATAYATIKALRQMPAKLMRPKAPKSGSRVLLERITFIWKRLSFLNKVTARNLFRYKKRLMMTVFGIAGCTALLLCGFTIKDTVSEMMPQQYTHIYKYDAMLVTSDDDFEEMEEILKSEDEIADYIPLRMESVEIFNVEGEESTIQMIIIPDGVDLDAYIHLRDADKQKVELATGDVALTKNATRVLDLKTGDIIKIQTQDLDEFSVDFDYIVDNYFGNTVYMTESTYRMYFETFSVNGVLAHYAETCEDEKAYTDQLAREKCILSATSTQAMEDEFDSAFALLNLVVYVILVLAAMLAFVVLFTLSNTNISERERELATIKVLGFYNPEVHSYVNKETLILSAIGILAGMPAGWALGRYVMGILELPSLEFYIDLYPRSYIIAGVITFGFTLIVNFITDRVLDKINMVEALKSVE